MEETGRSVCIAQTPAVAAGVVQTGVVVYTSIAVYTDTVVRAGNERRAMPGGRPSNHQSQLTY